MRPWPRVQQAEATSFTATAICIVGGATCREGTRHYSDATAVAAARNIHNDPQARVWNEPDQHNVRSKAERSQSIISDGCRPADRKQLSPNICSRSSNRWQAGSSQQFFSFGILSPPVRTAPVYSRDFHFFPLRVHRVWHFDGPVGSLWLLAARCACVHACHPQRAATLNSDEGDLYAL
jgi:hypothetical protein